MTTLLKNHSWRGTGRILVRFYYFIALLILALVWLKPIGQILLRNLAHLEVIRCGHADSCPDAIRYLARLMGSEGLDGGIAELTTQRDAFRLGYLEVRTGDSESALGLLRDISWSERWLVLNGKNAPTYQEGLQAIEAALKVSPNYGPALIYGGQLAQNHGDVSRAERLYRQALGPNVIFDPYFEQENASVSVGAGLREKAYSLLEQLYLGSWNQIQAEEVARRYLEEYPSSALALYYFGTVRYRDWASNESDKDAIRALHEAKWALESSIALDSGNPWAYITLGTVYKGLGNIDQSIITTKMAYDQFTQRTQYVFLNLADLYTHKGDYSRAYDMLQEGIKAYPDFVPFRERLDHLQQQALTP